MNYEYSCEICGIFEVQQKITEDPLTNCPTCLAKNLTTSVKKLISLSSFQLAGSGWAKDNYSK